jgi:hypothetical protein
MLALIPNLKRALMGGLFIGAALSIISCATEKKQVSLVDDPDANPKKDSAIPWNQQQKWEQGAEMGGLANTDRAHN